MINTSATYVKYFDVSHKTFENIHIVTMLVFILMITVSIHFSVNQKNG